MKSAKTVNVIMIIFLTLTITACATNKNQTSESKSFIDDNSSVKQTSQEIESKNSEEIPLADKDVLSGHSNHFSVKYNDDIFYMNTDGIHKLSLNGIDELYYTIDIKVPNLFLYKDYLYYCGLDGNIHSFDIQNKIDKIEAAGLVSCEFINNYMFTFLKNDSTDIQKHDEYVAYEIDPDTGHIVNDKPLTLSEIVEDKSVTTIMNIFSDFKYHTETYEIIPQKIAMINPLISKELYDGYYYYEINSQGNVSIKFESAQDDTDIIYYKKDLEYVLGADMRPIWTSYIAADGLFWAEMDAYGGADNNFPIYYAQRGKEKQVLLADIKDTALGQFINFDGQWVYYTARKVTDDGYEYCCYRLNIGTKENQLLYSTSYDNLYRYYTADIHNNKLFYLDNEKNNVQIIDLD